MPVHDVWRVVADHRQLRAVVGPAARADGHVVHHGVAAHHVQRPAHHATRVKGAAAEQVRHRRESGRHGQAGPQDHQGASA